MIDQAKRARRKAERQWRKTRHPLNFANFKKKRNYATNLMNKSRQQFYTEFIEENSSDQKKLFKAANKLFGNGKQLRFPENTDKLVLANDLSRYFVHKIETIRRDIDTTLLSVEDQDLVPPNRPSSCVTNKIFHSFDSLTDSNVSDLITNSSKKSCVLDPMPTSLICDSLDTVLPVITKMVNASLSIGHFPDEWKEAATNPLLKKGAKDTGHKNLRPVSNLQFVSKITERAVFNKFYVHVTENGLFPELQSAYRVGHSTETALLKIVTSSLT